ncbi:MAG: hypothetical protein CVV15_02600, partial [Gammaproteobacteria bacterium HGW-Gammaproteobacteria-5]
MGATFGAARHWQRAESRVFLGLRRRIATKGGGKSVLRAIVGEAVQTKNQQQTGKISRHNNEPAEVAAMKHTGLRKPFALTALC